MTKANMDEEFRAIYNEAHQAGMEAGRAVNPIPMHVVANYGGVSKEYTVDEGLCGFAWVNITPGTSSFAIWLKKNDLARTDSYYGGVSVWVHEFNQSIARKEAYADAFATVLNKHGITAYADSRLD